MSDTVWIEARLDPREPFRVHPAGRGLTSVEQAIALANAICRVQRNIAVRVWENHNIVWFARSHGGGDGI